MSFVYTSSNGNVFDFENPESPYRSPHDPFCNVNWRLEAGSSGASDSYTETYEVAACVHISASSDDEGRLLHRRLADAAECDCGNFTSGTIEINGYTANTYPAVADLKLDEMFGLREFDVEVKFSIDSGRWMNSIERLFLKKSDSGGLNFPMDFPMDFGGSSTGADFIENGGFASAATVITVYGSAENPRITVGGNVYEIGCTVPSNGKLVIDGLAKTVFVYDRYGIETNAYHMRRGVQRRGSGTYTFEKLPRGTHQVTWDGSFMFSMRVCDTRSAPPLGVVG